jgi:hypothetical protein
MFFIYQIKTLKPAKATVYGDISLARKYNKNKAKNAPKTPARIPMTVVGPTISIVGAPTRRITFISSLSL